MTLIYHGTNMLRWYFIKQNGILKCNMKKLNGRWVHTDNVYGPIMYAQIYFAVANTVQQIIRKFKPWMTMLVQDCNCP